MNNKDKGKPHISMLDGLTILLFFGVMSLSLVCVLDYYRPARKHPLPFAWLGTFEYFGGYTEKTGTENNGHRNPSN